MSPLLHVVRSTAAEEGERGWPFVGFSRIMDKFCCGRILLFCSVNQNKTKQKEEQNERLVE